MNKETYTKIFLKSADIAVSPASIKQYLHLWWKNTRNKDNSGLRLTEVGFNFLNDELELRFYNIPLPKNFSITTQTLIFLDKFINCPYYLTDKYVYVSDEKKSMELHLFSGDINKYGINKAMNRYEE